MKINWSGLLLFLPAAIAIIGGLRYHLRSAPCPSENLFEGVGRSLRLRLRPWILGVCGAGSVFFLIVGFCRPHSVMQWSRPADARNIMIALDISGSMRTEDFHVSYSKASRLSGVKEVISEFIKQRTSDRIGLIAFGSRAFLESPLTFDHELLITLVSELQVGMAGDGTAMGDGLGLSLKRLQEIPAVASAVILVTDGVNTSGDVSPRQAAAVASDLGVKVHTIGIGSTEAPARRLLPAGSEFDEQTLKDIAERTGGIYQRASSLKRLREVYHQINMLEKSEREEDVSISIQEYYPAMALTALCLYLLFLALTNSYLRRLP